LIGYTNERGDDDMLAALIAVAHEGHAGDHGWLAGAAQPLLSWDHFAAGVFVLLVVSVAVAVVARHAPRAEESTER
jgi:hydrogenase/urease accessory protein HupE